MMAGEMRLIDANALVEKFWQPECRTQTRRDFVAMVNYAPTIDAVEVIRCAQCMYLFRDEETQKLSCGIHGHTLMELTDQSFCSAGMTEAQWLALHGDELEDGDPLKPK